MALKSVGKDGYGYKCPEGGSTSRIGPPCPGCQPSARMWSLHSSLCAAVMWSVTAVLNLESCATHTHTDTHNIHTSRTYMCTRTHHTRTHTHTHAHIRLSVVSFRGTAAGGMGYWRSRFPYGEQGCTNWAILFVFVSFLRGCRSPCKRCNFSMKWLLKGSDAATSQKVEFFLRLGLAPYREAIFPRFRKMKLLNRSR